MPGRMREIERNVCACDPNPATTEGPVAECDLHGQPSVAFRHGYSACIRDAVDMLTVLSEFGNVTTVDVINARAHLISLLSE